MQSEHEAQRELVKWFRRKYDGVLIFAIPNGGKRGKAEAGRLKVEGVTAGVHDLHVPAWGLWVEMKKDKKSRMSKEQKWFGGYVESIGQAWLVGYGFDDAVAKIIDFKEGLE